MKLSALQKKCWRELWHLRGQVLAIVLVMMGGVAVCTMSLSTYDSLLNMRDTYYRDYGFADVFASVKRAPEAVRARIEVLPGVANVETRVVARVMLQVADYPDPVSGQLVSLGDAMTSKINRLYLLQGRMPDAARDNEVLISDGFAQAQRLQPGDSLIAIINGRQRELQIAGIALSPEYIYQIAPGTVFPDYARFGVLWMPRKPLAIAYGMDGAFNDVVLTLQPGANESDVIDRLDTVLDRYGGFGAYGRDRQYSNQFLNEEFSQLQTMALLFPVIFLGVAAFLLNVVIARLVKTQREIIAILKAFGYRYLAIGAHYAELVLIITALGLSAGFLLGMYFGDLMTGVYMDYYRFPVFLYTPKLAMFLTVGALTAAAVLAGTWFAVHRAVVLQPAEAMHPEPPERYHAGWLERIGLQRGMAPPTRMILRHLRQRPWKTMLSLLGLSMASAIMLVGNFQHDSVRMMVHVQFALAQKQDIEVGLYEPVNASALSSFRSLPGVLLAEGMRTVPVELMYGHRSDRTGLIGIDNNAVLYAVLDTQLEKQALPERGVLVTERLAEKLGFTRGDTVVVRMLDGERKTLAIPVARLSQQFLGVGAYMQRDALNHLLGEDDVINTVQLSIDPGYADEIYARLREMPVVASIQLRQTTIDSFNRTLRQILLVFTMINALLGAVIAFGVVYNTIRISLSERGRELASLRVLGYTHGEVAYILLGELAVLTLLSIPPGLLIGVGLSAYMADRLEADLYTMPLVISPYALSFSAAVVIASALLSSVVVWRRIVTMDLVEVLKTRE